MESNLQGMAIPFWSASEWHKAKAVLPDGHTFHATHGEFVALVARQQRQLAQQGILTVRVQITVGELLAWCAARGRQVNAQSRAELAARKAAQQDGAGGAA